MERPITVNGHGNLLSKNEFYYKNNKKILIPTDGRTS